MDNSKKINDLFNYGKTENDLMIDTINQSRAYRQIPRDPKLAQLLKDFARASRKLLLALDKALAEGNNHSIYLVNARANYKNRLKLLLNRALAIDAQLDQINLN